MSQPRALGALGAATLVNVIVCYKLAWPVEGLGIAMPPLVPAAVSCSVALLLAPSFAPRLHSSPESLARWLAPICCTSGKSDQIESGRVSIGGAGTFDGILLSGILALYLA